MFAFHRNVDAPIADGLTAISSAATCTARGPPTVRPSHHVAATPAMPMSATVVTTTAGSTSLRNALGASIQ